MTYRFYLPCHEVVGRRMVSLNLNWYRNAHHQISARAKRDFAPILSPVYKMPRFQAQKIRIDYTLVLKTKRRTDRMNWVSVVDKFFLDWLVQLGYIPDDDSEHYVGTTSRSVIDCQATDIYMIADVEVLQ